MNDGYPYRPKILRGAFVEFGVSVSPLLVVFQFNPTQLARNHALTFSFPGAAAAGSRAAAAPQRTAREFRAGFSSLLDLQKQQVVSVQDRTIGFDIRLDATDRIDGQDVIAEQFGIAPQLATLELMMYPKQESSQGADAANQLGKPKGFSFTRSANPPLVLFVFGRKRVLPVNINTMNITESEFSTELYPTQATVAVNLTVIEGQNIPYSNSKAATEQLSLLNLANLSDTGHVVVPG